MRRVAPVQLAPALLMLCVTVATATSAVISTVPAPEVTAFLKLAKATPNASCAQFSFNVSDAMLRLESGDSALGAGKCVTYGGYSEANTGLAKCVGWESPGIGAQLWTVLKGTSGTSQLQVKPCPGKLLGVVDCGAKTSQALEVCSSSGADCGSKGNGCSSAFDWTLKPAAGNGAASFELVSGLKGTDGHLCAIVTESAPPAPPKPRPVGPLPGGGGPWITTCNQTSACPIDQTCCKLNSSNWGCCPGPHATCCPGGVTCCPGGYACVANGVDAYNGATVYRCSSSSMDGNLSVKQQRWRRRTTQQQSGRRELPNWPPQLSSTSTSASTSQMARIDFAPHARRMGAEANVLTVRSTDGSAAVYIDETTGEISAVHAQGHEFVTRAFSTLLPLLPSAGSKWNVVVDKLDGGGIRVERTLEGKVKICEQFMPDTSAPSAVLWSLSVLGLAPTAFSLPISTTFLFDQAQADAELSWWAPWDQHSYSNPDPGPWADPLSPSRLTGATYNYGIVYGGQPGSDMVVAPIVSILHHGSDSGFSLVMKPDDPGLAWGDSVLEGINRTSSKASISASGDGNSSSTSGFAWHRETLKVSAESAQTFTMHIAAHAACWRPALGFSIARYPTHWEVAADTSKVALVDGLGSYGSFPIPQLGETGSLSDPAIAKMHYKVNWDLSGRFYRYMGMFAPPVDGGAPGEWLNRWNPFGVGGGRLTYNVSYTAGVYSIDALYKQAQDLGFSTLSYMNVFEFGADVLGHASAAAVTPRPDDYRNATLYAQNHLQDSILQRNWNWQDQVVAPNQGAWDSGILMDPGRESYKNEMVQQSMRRVANIPHFQGVVVDRSDYARFYNLEHDDGITKAGNASRSWSMKRSYLEVIQSVRGVFGTEKVMLMNSLGFSSLSFMPSYDGTFSEGRAINAVGLLGAGGMVNIMWTSNNLECCSDEPRSDIFFQRRLYLGVYAMAPLPAADHCIGWNTTIIPWCFTPYTVDAYVNYGPLFAAIAGKRYHLVAHAVTVTRGTAVANAFIKNGTMLYPVTLASTSSVTLELRGVPLSVTGFEAMLPGPNTSWGKVAAATKGLGGAWTVQVAFADARKMHAALVRSIDRSVGL